MLIFYKNSFGENLFNLVFSRIKKVGSGAVSITPSSNLIVYLHGVLRACELRR